MTKEQKSVPCSTETKKSESFDFFKSDKSVTGSFYSYWYYAAEIKREIRESGEIATGPLVTKLISRKWEKMGVDGRQAYIEKAALSNQPNGKEIIEIQAIQHQADKLSQDEKCTAYYELFRQMQSCRVVN